MCGVRGPCSLRKWEGLPCARLQLVVCLQLPLWTCCCSVLACLGWLSWPCRGVWVLMGRSLTSLRMGERIVCLTNTRIILNITRSHMHFSFCNWTRIASVVSWWGKFFIKSPCSYFPVRPCERWYNVSHDWWVRQYEFGTHTPVWSWLPISLSIENSSYLLFCLLPHSPLTSYLSPEIKHTKNRLLWISFSHHFLIFT